MIECRLRDAPSHGHFEAVADMLAQERRYKERQLKFPKIFETLGAEHFEQRALDNSAYILKDAEGVALDYILGDEPPTDLAPPLAPQLLLSQLTQGALRNRMPEGGKTLHVMGEQRCRTMLQASQQVVAAPSHSQISLNMAAAESDLDEGAPAMTFAEERPRAPTLSSYFAYLAQAPSPTTNTALPGAAKTL